MDGGALPVRLHRCRAQEGRRHPNYLVVDEDRAPLVPVIFELYAHKRMGAHAIAAWLNEHGHRTRAGRLWSHTAVLDVLRNRAYVGEVYFRGCWHPAPHPPLIDAEVFALAGRILAERGEDYSRRASNASDYLLSGLVTCAKCGRHYTGTAAHGRSATYRYYTCFSRQRYGIRTCDADRLPADALDAAVLGALLKTYGRSDLFDRAVRAAAAHANDGRDLHVAELAAVEAKIDKAEASIERYLRAFEDDTMPEAQCASASVSSARSWQRCGGDATNSATPSTPPPSSGDAGAKLGEVVAGELPLERSSGRLIAALEFSQALLDLSQIGEVVGSEGLALDHREVDLHLIEPGGMYRSMDAALRQALHGSLPSMRAAVVDHPEHPPTEAEGSVSMTWSTRRANGAMPVVDSQRPKTLARCTSQAAR